MICCQDCSGTIAGIFGTPYYTPTPPPTIQQQNPRYRTPIEILRFKRAPRRTHTNLHIKTIRVKSRQIGIRWGPGNSGVCTPVEQKEPGREQEGMWVGTSSSSFDGNGVRSDRAGAVESRANGEHRKHHDDRVGSPIQFAAPFHPTTEHDIQSPPSRRCRSPAIVPSGALLTTRCSTVDSSLLVLLCVGIGVLSSIVRRPPESVCTLFLPESNRRNRFASSLFFFRHSRTRTPHQHQRVRRRSSSPSAFVHRSFGH